MNETVAIYLTGKELAIVLSQLNGTVERCEKAMGDARKHQNTEIEQLARSQLRECCELYDKLKEQRFETKWRMRG